MGNPAALAQQSRPSRFEPGKFRGKRTVQPEFRIDHAEGIRSNHGQIRAQGQIFDPGLEGPSGGVLYFTKTRCNQDHTAHVQPDSGPENLQNPC